MNGAILEVLLVSAKGIGHTSIIGFSITLKHFIMLQIITLSNMHFLTGKPAYHVIVECSTQACRSKTSSGNLDKIYWNEKLSFVLSPSEVETLSHLKLKIVNEDYFTDGEFVGETIIFLKGIIVEGSYKGLIELNPAPFNVVLEDDTYKGELTIGLKFIPNIVRELKRTQYVEEEGHSVGKSICKMILSFGKVQWWRLLFSCKNEHKMN
ncbi:putative Ca2+-dependent phospholipid-binding protein [Handroanthus impetiginosus]|uniref:Putative Ca2+-dependent phospholipid-binding protein n=1 Tax=Handroanthus impetiginosus TaxID=429701 RepID=A0A2G9HZR8_9LAMI|nr:putative Ca2+-dependent phospholipid-binding protein [Handroanthus impetiginosus]